jgi:Icc protein
MKAFNVLQLTDLHILEHRGQTMLGIDTDYSFRRTLQTAHDQHGPFDLILLTGDLAQDPCLFSYQYIHQQILPYRTPCLCLPGNHDDIDLMRRSLTGNGVACESQRLLGNWSIIALSSQKSASPAGLLADSELLKLEKNLAAYPDKPTMIAMHHPCVASGSPWLDTMQIENSEELIAIIGCFPQVKFIVCGHIHQELSCQLGNVTLLATPSTCFQFTPKSNDFDLDSLSPGYRTLQLFADGQWRSQCHYIPESLPTLDRTAHGY